MKVVYINLTNGIEKVPELASYKFIRIQSTACEQKRWDFIIQDLDNDFLINLALGNEVVIYDYANKKEVSRAIFQGLEFIKFVLNKIWFDKEVASIVRGCNVQKYFRKVYMRLSKRTLQKIKYFRKFLLGGELKLEGISEKTFHDGQYSYYKKILKGD